MLNVVVFCNGGASTGILVTKIKKAAEAKKLDLKIAAYADAKIHDVIDDADLTLLGPQIGFKKKKLQEMFPGKIIETIDPIDYGMMNGEHVLEQIVALCKK